MAKKFVIKNSGKEVKAWKLGAASDMELQLIAEGKIVQKGNTYELFSQESVNGFGEIAEVGDFFKVDNAGYPYPNKATWFLKNHRHIVGDTWEQLPKKLLAWESSDELTPEVQFLIAHKGLKLNHENPSHFFGAELWGTWLTATSFAVLIFYSVSYDNEGQVSDADFNFVARAEFEATYHYC